MCHGQTRLVDSRSRDEGRRVGFKQDDSSPKSKPEDPITKAEVSKWLRKILVQPETEMGHSQKHSRGKNTRDDGWTTYW